MKLQQLGDVELRCLKNLRLANIYILEGVNASRSLLDFTSNCLRQELLNQFLQVAARRLTSHDVKHLLPDLPDLTRLRICRFLHLRWASFGKADGEEAEEIAISGFDVNMRFNEGLPFTDKGAEFIRGEVHPVEVRQTVLALNLVDS